MISWVRASISFFNCSFMIEEKAFLYLTFGVRVAKSFWDLAVFRLFAHSASSPVCSSPSLLTPTHIRTPLRQPKFCKEHNCAFRIRNIVELEYQKWHSCCRSPDLPLTFGKLLLGWDQGYNRCVLKFQAPQSKSVITRVVRLKSIKALLWSQF